jgi:AcrR family transcriptional regulator
MHHGRGPLTRRRASCETDWSVIFVTFRSSSMALAGKTKRDVVAEFRHAEILEAARQVFGRRGFAAASMEEISGVAGLAKGTLYLYYRSKQDLYRAALHAGLTDLCERLEAGVEAAPSLLDRIRAFVTLKVEYFESHRDFFRIYSAELGLASTGICERPFRDLCQRQVRLLERALKADVATGAVRRLRPESAANAIFDLTRGVITRRLLGWAGSRLEDDVDFVVDFAHRALVKT